MSTAHAAPAPGPRPGRIPGRIPGGRRPLAERIASRGTPPFDANALAVPGLFESDEEVDEFIAAVRRWRNEDE